MVELYLHSLILLHGVMFKQLSSGITLLLFFYTYILEPCHSYLNRNASDVSTQHKMSKLTVRYTFYTTSIIEWKSSSKYIQFISLRYSNAIISQTCFNLKTSVFKRPSNITGNLTIHTHTHTHIYVLCIYKRKVVRVLN
jgi:hypothetical protein